MRLPNVLFLLAIAKISFGTYEGWFLRVSIDVLPPGANLAGAARHAPSFLHIWNDFPLSEYPQR
jgi:hypothetical protein